jgi:hypothetical protein
MGKKGRREEDKKPREPANGAQGEGEGKTIEVIQNN